MAPDFELFTSCRYDTQLLESTANLQSWPTPNPKPSPLYMLPYHRDRMLQAAEHFDWKKAVATIDGIDGFSRLVQKVEGTLGDMTSPIPHGIRITLNFDGEIAVTNDQPPHVPLENLIPQRLPPPESASRSQVSSLTGGALSVGPSDSIHGDAKKEEPWEVVPDNVRTTPSPYTLYKTTKRDMYDLARRNAQIVLGDCKEVLLINDIDGAIMEGSITSVYFWRNGKWTTPPSQSGGQIGTTRRWALDKG